jgi:ABC-type Fe3+/spermidine/putrescine transport system ATPase subunit
VRPLPEARAQRPVENTHLCDQPCVLAGALLWLPPEILTAASTPLSSLDDKLRLETRVELKSPQRTLNVTAVHVTHDQEGIGSRAIGSIIAIGQ